MVGGGIGPFQAAAVAMTGWRCWAEFLDMIQIGFQSCRSSPEINADVFPVSTPCVLRGRIRKPWRDIPTPAGIYAQRTDVKDIIYPSAYPYDYFSHRPLPPSAFMPFIISYVSMPFGLCGGCEELFKLLHLLLVWAAGTVGAFTMGEVRSAARGRLRGTLRGRFRKSQQPVGSHAIVSLADSFQQFYAGRVLPAFVLCVLHSVYSNGSGERSL